MLAQQLFQVQGSHFLGFGTVQIQGDLTIAGHLHVRKRFLNVLKDFKKKYKSGIHFRAISEIGGNGRIHYHFLTYTDFVLTHPTMRRFWELACNPFPIDLSFQPVRSIIGASKYVVKDIQEVRERQQWVYLFARKTLPIPWPQRGFFQPNGKTVRDTVKRSGGLLHP